MDAIWSDGEFLLQGRQGPAVTVIQTTRLSQVGPAEVLSLGRVPAEC